VLTNVKPTGTALIQKVGLVARSNVSNGEILVIGAGRSNDLPNFSAADKYWYGGATGTTTEGDITSAGRALLDDADNTAQRTTLGLGTIATQAANSVALTGGTLAGISATTFTFSTGSIGTAVTGVTQSPGTNSTLLATTAYADAISALKATVELDNLGTVAINTSLISDTDITDDLGTSAIRWRDMYSSSLRTGDTDADTLTLDARDVDGAGWTTFITLTANNTPTCVLSGDVTGVTQSAADNSTKLATTAYADAAGAGGGATTALSNLASVQINTSLISDTDITDDLGTSAIRWRDIYSSTLRTGDTAADTLILGARDVDGASWTDFITLTANNTPTCVLASAVTGTTQAQTDNSTKLATTAYVHSVVKTAPMTVLSPSSGDEGTYFYTNAALTISEIVVVLRGGTSVAWSMKYGTDRSAAGTNIDTNTSSSTTTGTSYTTLDDNTVPADNFIWIEFTTVTGAVDELHFTTYFTYD
jgi:hypothetical protein